MQMTMNMATGNFKSSSASVSVALVVLLVAVMVPETSAQSLFKFVNKLDAPVVVAMFWRVEAPITITKTIAARRNGTMRLPNPSPVVERRITYHVRGCDYFTMETTGTVTSASKRVYITGHCKTGVAGLQTVSSIEGDATTTSVCAVPLSPSCTGPIS